MGLLKGFAENGTAQEHFRKLYSLHSLLNLAVAELPRLSTLTLELLEELLKGNQGSALKSDRDSLPNRNRTRMMQYGLVPVLVHASLRARDEGLRKLAEEMVKNCFPVEELEWNLKALEGHLVTNFSSAHKERARFLPEIQPKGSQDDDAPKLVQSSSTPRLKSKGGFPGKDFISYLYWEYSKQQVDPQQELDDYGEKYYILTE